MLKPVLQILMTLLTRVFGRAAQIVSFLVIARGLSPEGFGAYGLMTSAVILAGQLGNLGFRQAASVMIGDKRFTVGEIVATMLAAWPVLAACTVAGVLLLNKESVAVLGQGAVWPLAIAGAANLLIIMLQGVFLGRNQIRNFNMSDIAPKLLLSGFALLLFLTHSLSLEGALWAFAGGFALALPLVAWHALRGLGPLHLRLSALKAMIRYGFLFALSMFLISLNTRVGLFVLNETSTAGAVGQFLAAQRLNEIFLEIATAVGLVIFSRTASRLPGAAGVLEAARTAAWLFWGYMVVALAVVLATPLVIGILLGAAYADAVGMLRILAFGLAAASTVKIMNGVIAGAGRPNLSAMVIGASVLVNVATSVVAAPHLGTMAVAVGLVASQIFGMLAYAVVARVIFGVPLSAVFVPQLGALQLGARLKRGGR